MKRGKTRKNVQRYRTFGGDIFGNSMSGGVVSSAPARAIPPYAATANNATVLAKLSNFAAEINELSAIANLYRERTNALNDSAVMSQHLETANTIQYKADQAYKKAQDFWTTVYGSAWLPPPPSPAPAASA